MAGVVHADRRRVRVLGELGGVCVSQCGSFIQNHHGRHGEKREDSQPELQFHLWVGLLGDSSVHTFILAGLIKFPPKGLLGKLA